jgi:hypothetical protein
MKNLPLIVVLFIITACAPIRVYYDYERGRDFTQYKTYNYYKEMKTGLSELDSERLLNAMDAALQSRGFSKSDTPDFFIDINSNSYRETDGNNVGVGLGGGGGNLGGGVSLGFPIGQNNLNREIVVDFVDENKNGLFWQAVTGSSYRPNASPEKREAQFKAIVAKVLEGFPPEK